MKSNKKHFLFLLCIVLFIPVMGFTQEKGTIEIDSKNIISDGTHLQVGLVILGQNLDLDADELYRVDICLENGINSISLPPVLYTATLHYHYDEDSKLFYSTKIGGQKNIDLYRFVKGTNKYVTYWTPYEVKVPYEPWMRGAVVKVQCYSQKPSKDDILIKEMVVMAGL